ncbi:alpha/beta hydrolase [Danxiaibacter flavus]|uniref:Alpha/beta hydrolase n=1 Tax=Danxiaibacter flavus TaxID=3049108 RepID=A0ABV3ZEQ3_9BACT|nr:alpha/beta hydrolase [Chitinophagaceae bacterium DXS]
MQTSEVKINLLEGQFLFANLSIPDDSKGLVIFAHGSGSSRKSSRNRFVAGILEDNGFATLLTDLLTPAEDLLYKNRFNIALLSRRLVRITEWALQQIVLKALPVGYFGASTGAASALQAATVLPESISAIVSRGGRPDMARTLAGVKSPTLLIVGSLDMQVLELNQNVFRHLTCDKKLEVIKGASHLFEEPGTLHQVAHLAVDWFKKYLVMKSHYSGI